MTNLLQKFLRILSARILKKYKPTVIAVTGSVGKTSTKEAIFTILSSKYATRTSEKNYNTEIGVPLTIIGAQSGNRNPLAWLGVFFKAIKLTFKKDQTYPELLVLELATDRLGEIDRLASLVKPTIAVITAVALAHSEYLGGIDEIAKEKFSITKHVPEDGVVIVNGDDPNVIRRINQIEREVEKYGLAKTNDVQASNLMVSTREDFSFDPGETFVKSTCIIKDDDEEIEAEVR